MSGAIQKGLVFVVLASLGLNGVLLLRSGASAPPANDSTSAHGARSSASKAVTPEPRKAASEPSPQPEESPEGVRVATREPDAFAQCATELGEVRSELQRYLPAEVRFERGEQNPELAAAIEPKILENFDADIPLHDLECRGRVCRLDLAWTAEADEGNWMQAIQGENELRNEVCGMGFGAGTPTSDPITGDALVTKGVWLTMCEINTEPGMPVLEALLAEFKSSGEIERCKAEHPERGILSLRVGLQGQFVISAGGNLAATEAGKCISAALREMASETTIPEYVRGAVAFEEVVLQ